MCFGRIGNGERRYFEDTGDSDDFVWFGMEGSALLKRLRPGRFAGLVADIDSISIGSQRELLYLLLILEPRSGGDFVGLLWSTRSDDKKTRLQ